MKEIKTDKAAPPEGAYSQGIIAGDFIFISGEGPVNPQTKKVKGNTIAEQTEQALNNIKAILEAGGASMSNVVKASVLLGDMNDFKVMNEVYKTFFSEPFPTRICFDANLVPPDLIEVEAVAYMGK